MRSTIRYAIAILTGAVIPIAVLTHMGQTATAAAQTEPDYRSRTIYFLLADRFKYADDTKRRRSTLHSNLGFAPGIYRGVIAHASPANGANYVSVEGDWAVIHLEAISSLVLPN